MCYQYITSFQDLNRLYFQQISILGTYVSNKLKI